MTCKKFPKDKMKLQYAKSFEKTNCSSCPVGSYSNQFGSIYIYVIRVVGDVFNEFCDMMNEAT